MNLPTDNGQVSQASLVLFTADYNEQPTLSFFGSMEVTQRALAVDCTFKGGMTHTSLRRGSAHHTGGNRRIAHPLLVTFGALATKGAQFSASNASR